MEQRKLRDQLESAVYTQTGKTKSSSSNENGCVLWETEHPLSWAQR